MAGDFNYAILDEVAHRPWPMPAGPWLMTQTWHDLLFAHWRLPPARIRPLVPEPFALDLFEDAAWVGVVPFVMTNVAPRGVRRPHHSHRPLSPRAGQSRNPRWTCRGRCFRIVYRRGAVNFMAFTG